MLKLMQNNKKEKKMAAASYNFCIKGVHFSFNFGCYSTRLILSLKTESGEYLLHEKNPLSVTKLTSQ